MKFIVINRELYVGDIKINGISSSSILLVGDSQEINCSSIFDTPPEAVTLGPLVPLSPETGSA